MSAIVPAKWLQNRHPDRRTEMNLTLAEEMIEWNCFRILSDWGLV